MKEKDKQPETPKRATPIQILENGIRLAHKRGAFSMEESTELLIALSEVKKDLATEPDKETEK